MEMELIFKKISIVIPVYNSEASLDILLVRLLSVAKKNDWDFEIVMVDDCSTDNSWQVLLDLKAKYGGILKIVRLLNNTGQHNALLCGFYLSTGEVVITMDDDLQNPPEEIPKLVAPIKQGYSLVIGAYSSKQHSFLRNLSGSLIDWVLKRIFHLPNDFQLTSFRATRRIVIDNVCQMGCVFPYITAMLLSHSSNYINVAVRHDPRLYGKTNYNLKRGLTLAANLLFSYSSYPLYFVALMCVLTFLVLVGVSAKVIYNVAVYGVTVPGWASTVVIVSLFSAITLLSMVIFGVYISRINQQFSRSRVSYMIGELYE